MLKRRIVAYVLTLITLLCMSFTAFAAENGVTEADGVTFKTTTDKETYTSGDTAKFTISVTNNNNYGIKDVGFTYTLPEGFEIDKADIPDKIDAIAAGETKTIQFSTVVTSDTAAPETGGDKTVIIIIAAAIIVVIGIIAVVLILKSKKAAAIIVIGTLLAGSMSMIGNTSENVMAEEAKTTVTNADYQRVSVHDPSIVKDPKTNTYYIFGSHRAWAKSTDLISWKTFTTNINSDFNNLFGDVWKNYCSTPANSQLAGNTWAPDVIYNDTMKKWCMYMSINGNDWRSVIVLLTADNIEGPYEYVGGVMYSGFTDRGTPNAQRVAYSDVYKVLDKNESLARYGNTNLSCVNAIDPNVEIDENGDYWMTYGSWSAGIYQIKLDKNTGLRDYTMKYELKANESDPYLGYKLAGGYYNSGEGPYILKTDKYYYLFLSLGNLEQSGGYNMRVFRSESINGPYVDENNVSAITTGFMRNMGYIEDGQKTGSWVNTNKYNPTRGIKLLGGYNMYGVTQNFQVAQGHNSAFVDDDGKMYVVYHTRFAGQGEGHQVRVHQLFINETGWLTIAPYEYSGETLGTADIAAADVAGTYDFVVQRPDIVYAENAPDNLGESHWTNTNKKITVNSEEIMLAMRVDWLEDAGNILDNKGIAYAQNITLNADGTITGFYEGTWELTGGPNVKMTVDGKEYSGMFLEQQNELSTRDMTMTFTLEGSNQIAWGVKDPADNQ